MAGDDRGFASAFDALLERNRQQLDELMVAPSPRPAPGAGGRPAAASATRAGGAVASRPRLGPLDPAESPGMRALDERFGADGWRYEVAERRRDGDELIVLCRLSLPASRITKAQFGVARVDGRGIVAEEAAVREAVETALTNCIKLL